jgi:hypothetical protein
MRFCGFPFRGREVELAGIAIVIEHARRKLQLGQARFAGEDAARVEFIDRLHIAGDGEVADMRKPRVRRRANPGDRHIASQPDSAGDLGSNRGRLRGVAELLTLDELPILPRADMQRIAGGQGIHPFLNRGERRVAPLTVARVIAGGADEIISRSNVAQSDERTGGNHQKQKRALKHWMILFSSLSSWLNRDAEGLSIRPVPIGGGANGTLHRLDEAIWLSIHMQLLLHRLSAMSGLSVRSSRGPLEAVILPELNRDAEAAARSAFEEFFFGQMQSSPSETRISDLGKATRKTTRNPAQQADAPLGISGKAKTETLRLPIGALAHISVPRNQYPQQESNL